MHQALLECLPLSSPTQDTSGLQANSNRTTEQLIYYYYGVYLRLVVGWFLRPTYTARLASASGRVDQHRSAHSIDAFSTNLYNFNRTRQTNEICFT
jgi:hypothetical protein